MGQVGDSGRDIFEKENLITRKIKEINRASPGFGLDLHSGRTGLGVATGLMSPPSEIHLVLDFSNSLGLFNYVN